MTNQNPRCPGRLEESPFSRDLHCHTCDKRTPWDSDHNPGDQCPHDRDDTYAELQDWLGGREGQ